LSGRTSPVLGGRGGPDAESWAFWYLALTPLWWISGLLVPLGTLGIVWLYAVRPRTDRGVTAVCWLWFAVTAAQSASAGINWSFGDLSSGEFVRSIFSYSSAGWALLGMCIGVGCSYRLATPRLVRAVCLQALWILVTAALGYAVFAVRGDSQLEMPSLMAMALPSLAAPGKLDFVVRFFLSNEFMGDSMFRLVLFFPWSTGLALAGLTIILIAFSERSTLWRTVALVGGTVGFVLSYSRAVFAASVVAATVIVSVRSRPRTILWLVIGAGILADLALLKGLGPETGFSDVYHAFTQARPGSSEAREELYRATWRGFTQSPWIGHGWFGQTYARWMPVVIGSHSTFYGVLYQGGLTTFSILCVAYAATFFLCLSRLRRNGGHAAPQSLALLIVFGITSYGENMQTLVPSLLVSFVWIGSEMAARAPEAGCRGPVPARSRTGTPQVRAGVGHSPGERVAGLAKSLIAVKGVR
jgi:hypothetical protein